MRTINFNTDQMKKKILHIGVGLILSSLVILPSCGFLEGCGECTLVTEDNDGNFTYGLPSTFCGEEYLDKKDSEITNTIDGKQYWDCEDLDVL